VRVLCLRLRLQRATSLTLPSRHLTDRSTQVEQEPQLTFRGHSGAVTCVVFHPSRDVVYSGSLDATVRAWKVPAGAEHSLYSPHDASLSLGVLVGHTDGVWGLAVVGAEGQRRLVSASADGTVKVWDAEKPSPPLLLSWGYDGLETSGSAEAASDEAKPVPTSVCAVGSDASLVAVAYTNSVVKLFDASSGEEVRQLETDGSYGTTSPPRSWTVLACELTLPIVHRGPRCRRHAA
jgi:striatin 1/3/4